MVQCLHAFVSGRVQGVWFRKSTLEAAQAHGLTGWVRNLDDGRVEVMAHGHEHGLLQLEAWLSIGPELATVAEVKSARVEPAEEYIEFMII
ncbi:acylphosphatase [Amphritea sp. 2_MG-2023]|jgi:acylphosphatase|uniref:acylphosphatase n=1 Tax=Amphritea TaxID=515417 RepID=UPI001C071DDB|nr:MULTISPECIES: acylphosphatase [Amphritea]MBU2966320.1 acylphosphatase [Amphritea atlantica]MDO6420259.1 acylphosphatase [Amphritea sp. 2_MG-2023]MDX2421474.1 acylphosphatase [Amphritea sp.]